MYFCRPLFCKNWHVLIKIKIYMTIKKTSSTTRKKKENFNKNMHTDKYSHGVISLSLTDQSFQSFKTILFYNIRTFLCLIWALKFIYNNDDYILTTLCAFFVVVGICYGFEVMRCSESPDRPFTFLKTRFRGIDICTKFSFHVHSHDFPPAY